MSFVKPADIQAFKAQRLEEIAKATKTLEGIIEYLSSDNMRYVQQFFKGELPQVELLLPEELELINQLMKLKKFL